MSQTEQEPRGTAAFDPFDPFGYCKAVRDSGMDAWSKAMLDFVHSDAYARASAEWLDTYLAMSQPLQRMVDQTMTQTLGQWKLPSTDDMARLSERILNLELRLDDLDARADEMLALLRELVARPVPSQVPPAAARETAGPGGEQPGTQPRPAKAQAASPPEPHPNGSDGAKEHAPKPKREAPTPKSKPAHSEPRRADRASQTGAHRKGK